MVSYLMRAGLALLLVGALTSVGQGLKQSIASDRGSAFAEPISLPELGGARYAGASSILTRIDEAIRRGYLTVRYQPQVGLFDGRVHGVEGLGRIAYPPGLQRAQLRPERFFPVLETDAARLRRFSSALTESALSEMRHLPNLRLSLNTSALELVPGFSDHLARRVAANAFSPQRLTLEITERSPLAVGAEARLVELAAQGVSLALDDFGAGFSNQQTLARLRPYLNELKLDRSLVQGLETPKGQDKVRRILEDTHEMRVVIEGVTQERELDLLRELASTAGRSADEIDVQGYLYARPMTRQGVKQWLSERPSFD